ncbi:ATP12 family chaperone protein [Bauldia sp.]|uniref:ATP12 family chaperone protein n=1 Tax=Bauldia sp. TaxID=2575872 RepID=UPI003BACBBA2
MREKPEILARPDKPERPRRFYTSVEIAEREDGHAVLLDGREIRTPGRRLVAVADASVAEAMRAEWDSQHETIDPATMPLTRIVNTALDRVVDEMAAVRADIIRHAGSDLLLYRAEEPTDLVAAEAEAWDPILAWAHGTLGADLGTTSGIVHVVQDAAALAAVENAVAPFDALALTALHTATTLTGSAIVALAVARGRLTASEAWTVAHVDEDWQMNRWGRDDVALTTRAARWPEMAAAALVLRAG